MAQGSIAHGEGARRGIDGRFGWRVMAGELMRGYVSCEALTWITLASGLMLQRFALPAGGSLKISIATPLVPRGPFCATASSSSGGGCRCI